MPGRSTQWRFGYVWSHPEEVQRRFCCGGVMSCYMAVLTATIHTSSTYKDQKMRVDKETESWEAKELWLECPKMSWKRLKKFKHRDCTETFYPSWSLTEPLIKNCLTRNPSEKMFFNFQRETSTYSRPRLPKNTVDPTWPDKLSATHSARSGKLCSLSLRADAGTVLQNVWVTE